MGQKTDPPPSLPEEIQRYYSSGQESGRLATAQGELEFTRTKEIISRYLQAPPAVVLDVGGGPGAYACWLAKKGFEVHLTDPVPLHLEQAKLASQKHPDRPIQSILLGDARHLHHPDGCIDVVLLLGPLYHLTQRIDRITAMREAHCVLKPGGLLVTMGISRFASSLAGLINGYFFDDDFVQIARRDLADGQHRNPTGKTGYFTTAYFHHPTELEEELREAGFRAEKILAVEGPAVFLQDLEEHWKDPVSRENILQSLRWLEDEPSIMGVTGHIAAIGIKPD